MGGRSGRRNRLPIAGLPRASSLLARGCERVRRSRAFARELAAVLLLSYVVQLGAAPPLVSGN